MIYIHPKTQALIFDCDGTIADSMNVHNRAWQIISERYALNLNADEIAHYNGIPTLNILKMLIQDRTFSHSLEHVVYEKEDLAFRELHEITPIKPIVDLIKMYHKKLPMVVISGGHRNSVVKTLEILKIKDHFEFIITADDDHPTKDNPEAFIKIAKRLGVAADKCHVFEDGKPGLINAVVANMMVTDVRTFYP
ncbi:MAG: HAD family hydrolase [Francisellaceae bacterium]